MPAQSGPKLALTIQYAVSKEGLPRGADFRSWSKAALLTDVAATLRIVDEAEGLGLNRDFRGKDYATNVLTFAYGKDDDESSITGDIVLCATVVAREAAEQGKPLFTHYAHLAVHGMLHLQGYDHEVEADAVTMEAVESFIMQHMGYPDPYQI